MNLNKKILDLLENNQFSSFDLLEFEIEIFENIDKKSECGVDEAYERINSKLCKILRSYTQILIDPILSQIGYLEFKDLKKSIDNFLKVESKSSVENLDVRFDVLKIDLKLNTLALNAKVLLSDNYFSVKKCDVQTKFFKLNLG